MSPAIGLGFGPTWPNIGISSGGVVEFLGEIVLNDDATAEITTEIQGGLDYYVLELNCITPATDDTYLVLECSTDGGSTWHTTSGDYGYDSMWVDSSSGSKTTSLGYVSSNLLIGHFTAGNRQGNAAAESLSGFIHVGNLSNTSYEKGFFMFATWISPTGVRWASSHKGIFVANTNAVDGFRFRYASGNLKNGKIKVVGRQKTL